MDKFEQMVETIEEAEDMVECKECFDLFPKAECTKMDHGYICPTCGRNHPQDFSDVSFTDITTDLYDQEFPDVREYDSEFGSEMEERQKNYNVDDIVDALIKDEYDAIDSYELADEMIQEADVDEDMKDDLLDTIEHIREEEEEHIDEINTAAGRVEADPEDEDKKDDDSEEDSNSEDEDEDKDEDDKDSDKEDDKDEDKDDKEKNEDLTEAAPAPEMVEGEEILDEKKESVFNKIWKPVNESCTWVCKVKDQEIGTVEAATEEEAIEKMQKEYPEHNYGEYDGCFEVCQETVEDEEGSETLTEAFGDEKLVDATFGNYTIRLLPANGNKEPLAKDDKHAKVYTAKTLKDAHKYAALLSKAKPEGYAACIFTAPLDQDAIDELGKEAMSLLDPTYTAGKKTGIRLTAYVGGKEEKRLSKIDSFVKHIKTANKQEKQQAKQAKKVDKLDKKIDKKLAKLSGEDEKKKSKPEVEIADIAEEEPEVATSSEETAPAPEPATPETAAPETATSEEAAPKTPEVETEISDDQIVKMVAAAKATLPKAGPERDKRIAEIRKAILGESLTESVEEELVECAWCNREVPKCECRKEVDMGWLCDSCERAINSRGETLTFEEELKTTSDAMTELKDTVSSLEGAISGMSNMADAMNG